MKKLICSACVMIMMSFIPIEVQSMMPPKKTESLEAAESRIISELLAEAKKGKAEVPVDERERICALRTTAEAVVKMLKAEVAKKVAEECELKAEVARMRLQELRNEKLKAAEERERKMADAARRLQELRNEKLAVFSNLARKGLIYSMPQSEEEVKAIQDVKDAERAARDARRDAMHAIIIAYEAKAGAIKALRFAAPEEIGLLEEIKAETRKARSQWFCMIPPAPLPPWD